MTRRARSIALVLAGALVLAIGPAQARPGALDPSFGTGGTVVTAIERSAVAHALIVQPDGKLVAAGESWNGLSNDLTLARYKPDGALDPGFGSGGAVTTGIGQAYAVVLLPDGKLVAAGIGGVAAGVAGFALVRYNPDGTPDPSFGSGGTVTTAIGWSASARALVLEPDGKLVAAGESFDPREEFALARYNPDGTLDPSFGTGGIVTTAIASASSVANALALQRDGKLVAAGWSNLAQDHPPTEVALARYKPDGSLDASFGSGGTVTTAIGAGGVAVANALALQPDGKLVVDGSSWNGTNREFALARYNPDGTLDPGFGSGGTVTTAIAGSGADALALQPDGKLVAAGFTFEATYAFALARYNRDGSLDPGFGSGGEVTTAIGPAAWAHALALQPDGKLVAAGGSGGAGFTLARYLSDTPPCIVPKVTGKPLAAAQRAIRQAHCSAATVTKTFSAKVKKGRVISQQPAPGTKLPASTKVKLTVSKGRKR